MKKVKIAYDTFIKKAKEVNGDLCKYPGEDTFNKYQNEHFRVPIICPVHGEFLQNPRMHAYNKI